MTQCHEFKEMCLSLSLRRPSNWNLLGCFVGRGHDPADPLEVSNRLVERKMARLYRRAGARPRQNVSILDIWVEWQPFKTGTQRRGLAPALRYIHSDGTNLQAPIAPLPEQSQSAHSLKFMTLGHDGNPTKAFLQSK